MHQTMKKAWAILLTLCLLLGALPIGAQAALLQGEDYITQQLSLGEDLVLHLRASLPEKYADLAKDAVGTITYAGRTSTYTLDDLTPDETGMYDMPVEMAVAEMTEDIHAVVNGKVLGVETEILNEHYSIRDYLIAIIEGDYSQTTKDLCLELLNMGAWAQMKFNYNISNLANADYSITPANAVPDEIPAVNVEGAVDGITFYGTSVRFLSQTAVRFYFKADGAVDGYTFTIDGVEYEPVAKDDMDDMYYIETPGINPQNMSKEITASVTDGINTISAYYAPIWYFIRTYHKTTDEYNQGLMEAAYSYYKAAEDYKTQICMDLDVSTLSGDFESIGLGFYPLDFEGDINDYVDRIEVPTSETYTVKLDQGKYLVDGEFMGIGITVLGGPAWDATLEDGSADKHNIQISNLRLEGPEDRPIDLTFATIASGQDGTGYTNANAFGTATVADGVITIAGGVFTDGYKITFNEVDTYIKLDMNISTLSGDYETIGIGFYGYDFEGDINNYVDRIEVPTGETYTVKLDLSKYLAGGEFPGIGFAVLGGPTWDAKLEDGVTEDRHSITISNIRLEGELDQSIDLSMASLKSGTDGTGYTNANAGGTAAVADGIVSITGGFFTDGYKLTFVDETISEETEPETTEPEVTEPEETEPEETVPEEYDTTLSLDMQIDTISGTWANDIEMRFYAYNFEGNPHETYTDSVIFKAGEQQTVKLNAEEYLVDGELTGIGIGIFGGPAWDTQISDGVYDRHTVTISNVKLEGAQSKTFDLSQSTIASGTADTGYTQGNGNGKAVFGESIVISDGFCYDCHKISLVEDTNTYLCLDMELTTLGGSTDPVNIRLFNYNYEGSVGDGYTDLVAVTAGTTTTIKVKVDNYLVDGQLPGFGFAVFGGPEWNTKLADGTDDRHNIVISNVRLEGVQEQSFDLNAATVANGTSSTGFTWANSGGQFEIVDGELVVNNGYRYDAYEITFVDETVPEETEPVETEPVETEPVETEPVETEPVETEPVETEPPVEEYDTTLSLDMQIDTISGTWANDIEMRFYAYNFEGNPHETYTDSVIFKAGEQQTVKLNAEEYLVDGELTGIGIGIFGGPAWDTQISDGVYDRHTVTISNVKLEGAQSKAFDLSKSTMTSGTNGTGYTVANGSGAGAFVDGVYQITGGFCYDCHKISLVEDTNTYITMDMQIDTISGTWANDIEMRFYAYNFEGNPHETYTDSVIFKAGEQQTVKLNAEEYLVDGELTGIGIGIFGGPAWDTQISDGVYDRHTVTISNVKLEGAQSKTFDLSQSTIASGTNGTGYTTANGSGTGAFVDGVYQITGGFCYDCHKISLVEEPDTYLCVDMLFTTLGGSTDPVDIGFYPYSFEGDINNWTDKITVTAGTKTTVKLDAAKYMTDGNLTGLGFAIFGGPAWDAKLEDGYTADRHTITISGIYLEGEQSTAYDLSQSIWASGTNGTGYTNANGSGAATIGSEIVITNGFQYDGHKISLVEDTNTYLCLDMELTTLGGSTDPVNIRLFNYNYEGSVGDGYTDLVAVTAGTTTTIKVKVDNYLVDGQLPGFGFAVFGGPEWNTKLADGTDDRHNIVISNVRLEGVQEQSFDLNAATVANGTSGTGFTWANSGGQFEIVDGELVVNNGYLYDAYEITF